MTKRPDALINRVAAIRRSRGNWGLAKFLFQRCVFRRWNSILLKDPLGLARKPSIYDAPFRFQVWPRHDQVPIFIRELIQGHSGGEFLAELDSGDGMWVILCGAHQLAGWGGVYFESRQARMLALPPDAVLLGGGFIIPSFRNRGLYRKAINDAALFLARNGFRNVFSEVHPDNHASLRGLEAVGFERVREVRQWIILRYIVLNV